MVVVVVVVEVVVVVVLLVHQAKISDFRESATKRYYSWEKF